MIDIDMFFARFQFPRFHLRQIQNVVDDLQQMAAGSMNILGVFDILVVPQLAEAFMLDHFGKADDGVQGRSQFMTHIGEEFGFCPACHDGLFSRNPQPLLAFLTFQQRLAQQAGRIFEKLNFA